MSLCHIDHFPYGCDDESLHPIHHHHHHHHHDWCNSWFHSSCLTGQISITKEDGFQLQMDVHHFKYDDLIVKTMGEWIIVEGKQSGNDNDKPVCITRKFSRKYKLPRNYDSNLITSKLSSDGILFVKVPPPEEQEIKEKIITIEKPKPVDKEKEKEKDKTNSSKEKDERNKSGKKDKNANKNSAVEAAADIEKTTDIIENNTVAGARNIENTNDAEGTDAVIEQPTENDNV